MANVGSVNLARFTAVSAGTGSFVVSAAVSGYQTPATAGAVGGTQYRYRAESADLTQWELGTGVYTSSNVTLTRTPTINSVAGTSAINFTLAPQVGIVFPLAADFAGTGQLLGTATNDAATAGNVGEYISASANSSTLTSGGVANVTSISLDAGDWDIGSDGINSNSGNPTITNLYLSIATSSNTISAAVGVGAHFRVTGTIDFQAALITPPQRISLASSTTYFLNTRADFTGGTSLIISGKLFARRAR